VTPSVAAVSLPAANAARTSGAAAEAAPTSGAADDQLSPRAAARLRADMDRTMATAR
jgi:hypothetical protein